MKKKKTETPQAAERDELRQEYNFATMKGGVRGKYADRYRAGTNLALLEPDIAVAFPTDEAVNQALRIILTASAGVYRPGAPAKRRRKSAKG